MDDTLRVGAAFPDPPFNGIFDKLSIVGSDPWQRVYLQLAPHAAVPFPPDGG